MESSPQHYLALTLRSEEKFFYIFESRDKTRQSFITLSFPFAFSRGFFVAPFCAEVCFCAANTVPFFPANSILFVYTFVVQKNTHTKRNDNAHYWIVEHCIYIQNTWNEVFFLINHGAGIRTCDEHIAKNLRVKKRITNKFSHLISMKQLKITFSIFNFVFHTFCSCWTILKFQTHSKCIRRRSRYECESIGANSIWIYLCVSQYKEDHGKLWSETEGESIKNVVTRTKAIIAIKRAVLHTHAHSLCWGANISENDNNRRKTLHSSNSVAKSVWQWWWWRLQWYV